jgi:hypothetical protein
LQLVRLVAAVENKDYDFNHKDGNKKGLQTNAALANFTYINGLNNALCEH